MFTLSHALYVGFGFVLGAFFPGVIRTIRSFGQKQAGSLKGKL